VSTHLTPDQADALNAAATVHPFDPQDGSPAYPCIEIGGVQVYAYAHPERGTLQISVHFDTAEEPLLVEHRMVPLQIDLTGETPLYAVNEYGRETYPQLQQEVAEAIAALEGVRSRVGMRWTPRRES
jgi:hypothetical protein